MPIMFQTGRALSALGSLARATVLVATFVALFIASQTAAAAEATPIEQHIEALVPSLEDYISANMKSFDVPGLAMGIVAGDKLIYAKGFGARTKGGAPVDTQTLFRNPWVAHLEFGVEIDDAILPMQLHPSPRPTRIAKRMAPRVLIRNRRIPVS